VNVLSHCFNSKAEIDDFNNLENQRFKGLYNAATDKITDVSEKRNASKVSHSRNLLGVLDSGDRGTAFLQKVGNNLPVNMA
jgi:hypothetical protein